MRRLAALLATAILTLSACSEASPSPSPSAGVGGIRDVNVTISDTSAPLLQWDESLTFENAESKVLWEGEGARLVDGQPLLLDIFAQSLETGVVLENTFDGLPRSFLLAPELLGDELYQLLRQQRQGARVMAIAPSGGEFEEETAFAVVIDVLPHHAHGETLRNTFEGVTVTESVTGEPTVRVPEDQPMPATMVSAVMARGSGPQVRPGSYIIAQYKIIYGESGSDETGAWVAGDEFDSTWPIEKAPYEVQIGVGKTIRALDESLIDQPVGSRVLIIAPDTWAYPGKGTLILVVDILDVWNPEG